MESSNFFPLQMECTLFFQENPFAFETADGLALRLGRKTDHLLPVLQYLVSTAILEEIRNGDNPIYRYIQPSIFHEDNLTWEQV
jgi:hypothetical protein